MLRQHRTDYCFLRKEEILFFTGYLCGRERGLREDRPFRASLLMTAPRRNRIRIFHPDYEPPQLLFLLPADDAPEDGSEYNMTPYFVVHDAVHAFANNPADGWLSKSQDGSDRIDKTTVWLKAGNYFFHVSGPDKPWPVVANFDSWSFPHAHGAPSHWREAANFPGYGPPLQVTTRCVITTCALAMENAHIIPRAEKSWFEINRMDQYGTIGGPTRDSVADSCANRIWLRVDAQQIWDQSRFTIIPDVQDRGDTLKVFGWRTHRLNEHQEVLREWHNKPLQPIQDCVGEYLYARFLWDLFPLIQGFLDSGPPLRLVTHNQSQSKYEIKMLTQAERRVFTLKQSETHSASPTKRQRSAQPGDLSDSALSSGGSEAGNYGEERYAFKKPRLLSPDGSQDSAVTGTRDSPEDSDCEPNECRGFLAKQTTTVIDHRGRSRWRS